MALLSLHVHPPLHLPHRVQPPHLQRDQELNEEEDDAHKVLIFYEVILLIQLIRGQRKEIGLAMMLFCVVAIFFICHILALVVNILEVFFCLFLFSLAQFLYEPLCVLPSIIM